MLPVDKSAITPNVKVAKKTARFERKEDTPCTPKKESFTPITYVARRSKTTEAFVGVKYWNISRLGRGD